MVREATLWFQGYNGGSRFARVTVADAAHLTCAPASCVQDNRSICINASPSDVSVLWKMALAYIEDLTELGAQIVRCTPV